MTLSSRPALRPYRAIFFKEWVAFRRRWKSATFTWIVFVVILGGGALARLSTTPPSQVLAWHAQVAYTAALVSAATTLSTLRFWQEKSGKTLDTLLALPFSLRSTFLAKASFPAGLGVAAGLLAALMINMTLIIFLHGPLVSPLLLLAFTTALCVVNSALGIINGYAMWAMSESAAKIVQIMTMGLFVAAFASIAVFDPKTFGLSAMLGSGIVGGLLVLVALVLLVRIRPEQIVLNQGS